MRVSKFRFLSPFFRDLYSTSHRQGYRGPPNYFPYEALVHPITLDLRAAKLDKKRGALHVLRYSLATKKGDEGRYFEARERLREVPVKQHPRHPGTIPAEVNFSRCFIGKF